MTESIEPAAPGTGGAPERRFGCLQVAGLLLVAVVLTAAATFWLVRSYIFPADFTPVSLDAGEQQQLQSKLVRLEAGVPTGTDRATPPAEGGPTLTTERYSEAGARREISLSERELNALLARNTDLARKLAIDLSEDLVSAKLLVPVDPDFPILGGQVIKVRAGMELAYRNGRPEVVLRGVSIMGVPLPNAWLGGIKNIDLVGEFGRQDGFWKSFAEGVEHIRVADGQLHIKLKE